MNIICNCDSFLYAVIEYLASSKHIHEPVDHPPQQDSQYRVVCLATASSDAWQIAHLLNAVHNGQYTYTVCPTEVVNGNDPSADATRVGCREENQIDHTPTTS